VINKLKAGEVPVIYGTDYPTPDGTCIRDYVDVRDVAYAHLLTINSEKQLPLVMNVGTGKGASVREVINLVSEAAGKRAVKFTAKERRSGDAAVLCADISLIDKLIGFQSKYSLREGVDSLFLD
jgi:UDP-glucose 4-epimerase